MYVWIIKLPDIFPKWQINLKYGIYPKMRLNIIFNKYFIIEFKKNHIDVKNNTFT